MTEVSSLATILLTSLATILLDPAPCTLHLKVLLEFGDLGILGRQALVLFTCTLCGGACACAQHTVIAKPDCVLRILRPASRVVPADWAVRTQNDGKGGSL